MISPKAYGLYMFMLQMGRYMPAKALSEVFEVGVDYIYSGLKELREAGLIETHNETVGSRIINTSTLVDPLNWTRVFRTGKIPTVIQQYEQNSNLNINAYSTVIQIKNLSDEKNVGWEGNKEMEDWYQLGQIEQDPEDLRKERERARKRKQEEIISKKQAKTDQQLQSLASRTPATWTIKNAVYEFKSRLIRWDVKPWEGTTEPFSIAFAKKRNEFDTQGIEDKMMDLFFARYDHENSLKDPEMLWRTFIRDFGSLANQVRQEVESYENFDKIKEEADKSWEKLINVQARRTKD